MKVKTAAPRVIDFESHLTNQMMRSPRYVPKYPGIRNFLIKSLMSEWDAVRHALRERFVREDKTNFRQKLEKRQKEEGITAAVDAYLASHTWAPYEPFPKFKHVTKDNLIHILVDKKNSIRGTLEVMKMRTVSGLSKAELVQHVFNFAKLKAQDGGAGAATAASGQEQLRAEDISKVLEVDSNIRKSARLSQKPTRRYK